MNNFQSLKTKQKKSALKTLVSYDVFTIFTTVKHKDMPCEAKTQHGDTLIFNVT